MSGTELELAMDGQEPGAREAGLRVAGEVRVHNVAELARTLLKALEKAEVLKVDLSGLTGADITLIQTLCAANKEAFLRGKRIRLVGCCSELLAGVLRDAGFCNRSGCMPEAVSTCLWTHMEEAGEQRG